MTRLALICCAAGLACMALGCVSKPERGAHEPSVAARHTPVLAASGAAPSGGANTASAGDSAFEAAHIAARAFDPPAELRLPSTLNAGERVPLLLVLHGFGVSSSSLVAKASLYQFADLKKFAYLAPEGLRDGLARPFWNAGKSCCDLDHQGVDDVKRLRDLLDASLSNGALDPQQVFVIGYSNGGFMAQRLACEVGNRIAGVISVAGAAPSRDIPCAQSTFLSFLEIHGDADPVVHYAGGTVFDRTDVAAHSSAPDTAKYWAERLGCTGSLRDDRKIDIEPYIADRETAVQRYDGCRGAVELWTVRGGGHYVALQPPALEAMWAFIVAHPKGGTLP